MIIKPQKGRNEILICIIFVSIVLIGSIRFVNFNVFIEDIREKILTYDLGFSRFHNLFDDDLSKAGKFVSMGRQLPKIVYSNIVGYERKKIDNLSIDIGFLDYQKILLDRDIAIKNQILFEPTSIKAEITYKGKKYKAKVRLKGDLPDHWTSVHRLSLRVKLKGDKTIHGLNEFNIQKPRTRSFPYDAVFQDIMRATGNLATEHNYVRVNMNGNQWGVMNLESHIDKAFLERNKRKESVVVRFSNEEGWRYVKNTLNTPQKYYRLSNPLLFSKVYSSEKKFDINKRRIYSYIVEKRIEQNDKLYDVNSYLRLLTLSKLWGGMHSMYENNTKHYFNPYNLKLEPISSDQFQPRDLENFPDLFNLIGGCQDGYQFVNEVYTALNNVQNFNSHLIESNEMVFKKMDKLDYFFEKHHSNFPLDKEPNSNIIQNNINYANGMGLNFFTINEQCKEKINQKIIDDWKNSKYILPAHIQGFHYEDGGIKIYNLLPDKVSLIGLRIDQSEFIPIEQVIPGHNNFLYTPYFFQSNMKGLLDNRIEIVTKYQGKVIYHKLYKTLLNAVENPLSNHNSDAFKFLSKVDEDSWIIPKGEWFVESPIIIHGNLFIEPGVKLFFDHKAYLAVNGGLIANGNKKNKIELTSKNNSWMGLYVYESNLNSILNHIVVSNVSSINDGLLNLTGGVNFYRADVEISNSEFIDSKSEDMLNIVESKFLIRNTIMQDSYSDALDIDFSTGEIQNLNAINIKGDAVDTSGSNLSLKNFTSYNIHDKAISIGESSTVSISNCNINNIGVGIASKDGSSAIISGCFIKDAKLAALMTYRKKSFYNSPSLEIKSSNIEGHKKFIRQKDSILMIDGEQVPDAFINVDELYKSSFMKK